MQSNQHFTTMNTGGRQLVVIGGGESMQKTEQSTKLQPKMVIDLTKPPPTAHQQVSHHFLAKNILLIQYFLCMS